MASRLPVQRRRATTGCGSRATLRDRHRSASPALAPFRPADDVRGPGSDVAGQCRPSTPGGVEQEHVEHGRIGWRWMKDLWTPARLAISTMSRRTPEGLAQAADRLPRNRRLYRPRRAKSLHPQLTTYFRARCVPVARARTGHPRVPPVTLGSASHSRDQHFRTARQWG